MSKKSLDVFRPALDALRQGKLTVEKFTGETHTGDTPEVLPTLVDFTGDGGGGAGDC